MAAAKTKRGTYPTSANKNKKQGKTSANRKKTAAKPHSGNQRKSGNQKKSARPQAEAKPLYTEKEAGLHAEVFLWVLLAIAIFMVIANMGIGGFVGNAISYVMFGCFGYLSYLFPVFLFLGVAFMISNRENPLAYKKIAAAIGLFIVICAFLHMLMEGDTVITHWVEYFTISATYKTGGGIIGGILGNGLSSAFGKAGAYVILCICFLICGIIMTQRSFLEFLYKMGIGIHERQKAIRMPEFDFDEEEEEFGDDLFEMDENRNRKKLKLPLLSKKESNPPLQEEAQEKELALNVSKILAEKEEQTPKEEPAMADLKIHQMKEVEAEEETPKKKSAVKNPRASKEEAVKEVQSIEQEMTQTEQIEKVYQYPPLTLLKKPAKAAGESTDHLRSMAMKIQDTLRNFGVNVTVTNVSCGPSVTRYELHPEQGVKVSKIVGLTDDLKLNLAAADIRIEAPIPGKAAIGIEVPNKTNSPVMLRELLQSEEFLSAGSRLAFAAGKDIAGQPVIADIAKMPHLLIAGATGSGKSVCINTLIMSILYKASPDEVKMIMIDPKVVELSVYNGVPHLFIPVVTDPKKAAGALNWAVQEMTNRYNAFAEYSVRNLADYNRKISDMKFASEEERPKKMPQIVIIVDELADLMMVAPGDVEDAICRLAQLARAAGIHLIIATQRPSVNVITGLIKANMPSRIAFSVSSSIDSRTILDMAGAERLLGKGDMLFYPQGYNKPARVQGAFVSDEEVSAVVEFLASQGHTASYSPEIEQQVNNSVSASGTIGGNSGGDSEDAYFAEAGRLIIEKERGSIGMLQRMFKIGFNRAARIMDQLADAGVVGPEEGTKPRKILMTMEEFEEWLQSRG